MAEDKEIDNGEASEAKEQEVKLPVVPLFGKWDLTEVEFKKVQQIVISKRLRYNIFFEIAHKFTGYCLLANSDIYFDEISLDGQISKIEGPHKSILNDASFLFEGFRLWFLNL